MSNDKETILPALLLSVDLEEEGTFKESNGSNDIKSILIKTKKEKNDQTPETIIKLLLTIIIVTILTPIIIYDLYIGLNDNSCVEEYPSSLNINLRVYMITSALIGLTILIITLITFCFDNINSNNNCIISFGSKIFSIFHLIWNILGGFVFWGFVYKNNLCNKNVSTYLSISITIKYVANYFGIRNAFNNEN
jgi:hypothetical protein